MHVVAEVMVDGEILVRPIVFQRRVGVGEVGWVAGLGASHFVRASIRFLGGKDHIVVTCGLLCGLFAGMKTAVFLLLPTGIEFNEQGGCARVCSGAGVGPGKMWGLGCHP